MGVSHKLLSIVILLSCSMYSISYAQGVEIKLAWDYASTDEVNIDGFVLQRKFVNGTYQDVGGVIAKNIREVKDENINVGVVYCYQMLTQKVVQQPVQQTIRSRPSNEVCGAFIGSVSNLRLQ